MKSAWLCAALAAICATATAAEPDPRGKTLFAANCATCHGEDARGLKGQGANLADSTFIKGLNDAQLLDFVKIGRQASDAESKMNLMMPAFDYLDDADLKQILAYVRSISKH